MLRIAAAAHSIGLPLDADHAAPAATLGCKTFCDEKSHGLTSPLLDNTNHDCFDACGVEGRSGFVVPDSQTGRLNCWKVAVIAVSSRYKRTGRRGEGGNKYVATDGWK